jgi:tetratricopeptide (TPR) repeat protein
MPLYVEGQVINETGKAPDNPVPVRLNCGMRTLQTIRTDLRGYFRFTLGLGAQANADFSAADTPMGSGLGDNETPSGLSTFGGFGSFGGNTGFGSTGNSLNGCDIRISVPGYMPIDILITDIASLGTINIGMLELRRVGTAPAGSISVTSLLVPKNAQKEFDQGIKDIRNNRVPQATQHLERAVREYDKFAAAWTELGKLYAVGKDLPKAREAYGKAIAADPKFAPPYVGLGAIQLQEQDYEGALESIDSAANADPTVTTGLAGYIQGVANFRLNRMDAARESLLQAEKGPHPTIPQLHVLLADLYLDKQDSASAAMHMRAYLKEAPEGTFAAEMKESLAKIDQAAANDAGSNVEPAIAH